MKLGIRPVMRGDRLEGATIVSRFPVAFRLPAFASWSSDSRRGVGPSSRLAYRARPSARTSTGLPRSARTSCDRGGCPLYPEDDGAHPAGSPPRPAPAASQRPVPKPRHIHRTMRGSPSRGINRGLLTFTRPVFPSPAPPGWNRRRFGFPPSFAPRRHQQRTSRVGTGHRARTWNYRSTHIRRSPIR